MPLCGTTLIKKPTRGLGMAGAGVVGHDPAAMLRRYAKKTKKADSQAAEIIGLLSKGALQ
jgi:hypothetical protein